MSAFNVTYPAPSPDIIADVAVRRLSLTTGLYSYHDFNDGTFTTTPAVRYSDATLLESNLWQFSKVTTGLLATWSNGIYEVLFYNKADPNHAFLRSYTIELEGGNEKYAFQVPTPEEYGAAVVAAFTTAEGVTPAAALRRLLAYTLEGCIRHVVTDQATGRVMSYVFPPGVSQGADTSLALAAVPSTDPNAKTLAAAQLAGQRGTGGSIAINPAV